MMAVVQRITSLLFILFTFATIISGEKSSGSEIKSKHSSVSRNGIHLDQMAEESRVAEVEAAEMSYATSGGSPPPIPVPMSVQVRPGALVLPSPSNGQNFNKMQQDMAGYESQRVQTQVQVPANFQQQQQQQQQQPRGPPPPQHKSQPSLNQVPQFIHDQQQQQQQQGPPPQMQQGPPPQMQQGPPPQMQQGPPPQMQQPQLIPQPKLDVPRPFQMNGPPPPQNQQQQQQQGPNFNRMNQKLNEQLLPPPQQKAQDQLLGQHSHSLPSSGPIGESGVGVVPVGMGSFPGFAPQNDELWPQSSPELPQIQQLEVKCEKNLMKVAMKFDKPFFGVIFSKGNYDNERCVYLRPGQGRVSATFDIAIDGCGTFGSTQNNLNRFGEQTGSGSYFENTIVIQYDPFVQEVWDQARKLRCSWHDYYEKSVTFKPFNVEMMDIVHTDFAGDNVGCWMQIQVGKGPWANEVSGIVKIGQTLTMVLAIKDEENKFDMLVRSCVAHDGKRNPIELVDDQGCIARPKLMSKFQKIKNFGASASVLSYAHLQAFKFPDSMDVHFQCTIQICRYQCPEQCSQPTGDFSRGVGGQNVGEAVVSEGIFQKPTPFVQGGRPRLERSNPRFRRDVAVVAPSRKSIGVNGNIKVVSSGDFAFNLDANNSGGGGGNASGSAAPIVFPLTSSDSSNLICISTPSFTVTLIFLLAILVISCIISSFLCLRHWRYSEAEPNGDNCTSSNGPLKKPKRPFYHFLWVCDE